MTTGKELAFNKRNSSSFDSGGKQLRMNTDTVVDKFTTHLPDSCKSYRFWKQIWSILSFLQSFPLPSGGIPSSFKWPSNASSCLSVSPSTTTTIPYIQVTHHRDPIHTGSFHSKCLCSLHSLCWKCQLFNTPLRNGECLCLSQLPAEISGKEKPSPPLLSFYTYSSIHPTEHFSQAHICLFLQTIFYISDPFIG